MDLPSQGDGRAVLRSSIREYLMSEAMHGPGLGLTVSKKIIEEHGGSIKVNSYIGIGTSVIVTLPIIK